MPSSRPSFAAARRSVTRFHVALERSVSLAPGDEGDVARHDSRGVDEEKTTSTIYSAYSQSSRAYLPLLPSLKVNCGSWLISISVQEDSSKALRSNDSNSVILCKVVHNKCTWVLDCKNPLALTIISSSEANAKAARMVDKGYKAMSRSASLGQQISACRSPITRCGLQTAADSISNSGIVARQSIFGSIPRDKCAG